MANNEKIGTSQQKVLNRVFYMDNIRIYLTVLVILHHIALGYGGLGGWFVYETDFRIVDDITKLLFVLFNVINQAYFMAFFFLLAGYFTPRSFEKKGGNIFLKDRLIRLGIPVVIYVLIFSPLVEFIVKNFAYTRLGNPEISFLQIYQYRIENLVIGVDHLWFLQALLIFAFIYVLYKGSTKSNHSPLESTPYMDQFPTNRIIIVAIGIVALATYLVRGIFPIGETVLFNFQFAHFIHYGFCFWIGILAKNGNWFENLPAIQAKRWVITMIILVIILPIILVLLVNFDAMEPFDPFLGKFTFESFIYAFWESAALLAFSISLIYIFRVRISGSNNILNSLSGSAYTAYIIHAIVIVSIMILFLPLELPAILKFIIVALIGIPLIFILSHFIRKIPYLEIVLG